MSEIEDRAEEIREIVRRKKCVTYHDLMVEMDWPIQSIIRADEVLGLGLVAKREGRGPKAVAQAVPKPVAKKK